MKLHQLNALVAIAKAGSIQEAARLMHLTQPALSKSVRELEREVGVPLLVRSVKGATLTPYGAVMARHSKVIQKEVDRIGEEIDSLRGILGGRITIGLTPPSAGATLAEVIRLFRQKRPSVDLDFLELRPIQILEGLRDGTLDFGIVSQYGEAVPVGFEWSKLFSLRTLLVIGGKREGGKISLQDLYESEWVVPDSTDDPGGYIATFFSQFGHPVPPRVVRCTSIRLYWELASRLNVITHWAEEVSDALDPYFRSGRMTRLETNAPMPEMNVLLVYQDEDMLTPAAREFMRILSVSATERHGRGAQFARR